MGGFLLLKLLLITPLARGFGVSWRNALRTGLLLGPGGEFAFVIISVALAEHLLSPEDAQRGSVRHCSDDGDHSAALRCG